MHPAYLSSRFAPTWHFLNLRLCFVAFVFVTIVIHERDIKSLTSKIGLDVIDIKL